MRVSEKSVDISSAGRKRQPSAEIFDDANAMLQKSLLNACNLRELIDLINLDMANVLADEIEDSIEDISGSCQSSCRIFIG